MSHAISVIVLNYNGEPWLARCLDSLLAQEVEGGVEILVADNASTDSSTSIARAYAERHARISFIDNGENLGFCAGNNRPAKQATGVYLLFLNNDTWLEPGCLNTLIKDLEAVGAAGGAPLVKNYADDSIQSLGAAGFDLCGFYSPNTELSRKVTPVMAWSGCAFLIRRDVFFDLGCFDETFFMYADEWDLCWRFALAGHTGGIAVNAALHHRSEAAVNPKGATVVCEFRTSVDKRYYANRNNLITVLKNAQHVLLILAFFQVLLLVAEGVLFGLLAGNRRLLVDGYFKALADCWRMREHIIKERQRIARLRVHSDWWMLRYFKLRPNRWAELMKVMRKGIPKVS